MALSAKATQEFVPIKEVREGVIVLKDGSLRTVVMASSINFALKSEDERAATLYQFQNFLNSLDFSLQIVAQSRRLDIRPYITLLESRENEQVNELLKIQTREYINFIKTFTENSNIMTKHFFIVVPYSPAIVQTKIGGSKISGLFGKKSKKGTEKSGNESFAENLTQLEQRVALVEQGLISFGIRAVTLKTEEVVELFYKTFNPGETEKAIKLEK